MLLGSGFSQSPSIVSSPFTGALKTMIAEHALELQSPKLRSAPLFSSNLIYLFRVDSYFKSMHNRMQDAIDYSEKARTLFSFTYFLTGVGILMMTSHMAKARWFRLTYKRSILNSAVNYFFVPMGAATIVSYASGFPLKALQTKKEIFEDEAPYWQRVDEYLNYLYMIKNTPNQMA